MSGDNLEKIIKLNHPFVNEYYKGVVGIMLIENIIFNQLEVHLNKFRLTYQQFNILRILKGQYPKGVQLSLLKDRMLHKQSDVSRLVVRLTKMGWVEKHEDKFNKRKLYIRLSEEGLKIINSIDINGDNFKSITTALNDEEIITFNNLIHKLIENQVKGQSE